MSGKGNCYDNSMVETFFKSIKAELIWRNRWDTRRQAEGAIFQYINGFYNPRRRHSCAEARDCGRGEAARGVRVNSAEMSRTTRPMSLCEVWGG